MNTLIQFIINLGPFSFGFIVSILIIPSVYLWTFVLFKDKKFSFAMAILYYIVFLILVWIMGPWK